MATENYGSSEGKGGSSLVPNIVVSEYIHVYMGYYRSHDHHPGRFTDLIFNLFYGGILGVFLLIKNLGETF